MFVPLLNSLIIDQKREIIFIKTSDKLFFAIVHPEIVTRENSCSRGVISIKLVA